MLSRIFWIFMAVLALVGGIAVKERDLIFSWGDDAARGRAIEARIFDHMEVRGSDGRSIDVAPETKRAMGDAIGRLVSAETELALAKVRHADEGEMRQASAERAAARAEVERLKAEIDRQKQLSESDRNLVREQIQQKIRDDIRASVRDAVRQ